MAEQLGAAELQLDVNSSNFKTKLDAAELQLLALQRVADSVGTSLNNIFAKNYRIGVNDSQVAAANIRLDKTLAKLREITTNPYNIRLNFIQSGAGTGGGGKFDPGRIVDDAIDQILKQGLSGQATQILRGGGGAGASRVGAARSQELRETLLARVERGSLGAGGFNIPGLQEIVRQLGQTPLPKTSGRAKILQQARDTIQQASDAVINRIGQDLLDLQLSLKEEGGGAGAPKKEGAPKATGPRAPSLERSEDRLLSQRLRIEKLEARGVETARLRQQLDLQSAAIQEGDLKRARELGVQLQRQIRIKETDVRADALRRARTKEPAVSVQTLERADKSLEANRIRIDKLEARGVEVAKLRQQLDQQRTFTQKSEYESARRISVELEKQLKIKEADLDIERIRASTLRRQLGPKPPPPPLPGQATGREAQQVAKEGLFRGSRRDAISSGIIGFGFPLLFGQGLGAAAGGGFGGTLGGLAGGGFGFGLSIIGTAVGAQLDIIITKSKDLASALSDPIAGFDLLKQNSQLSSRGTERYIEALIKVGREGEAAALIQQDLSDTYGNLDSARALVRAQDDLARSWTQLSSGIAGLIVPGLAEYLQGVANALHDFRNIGTPEGAGRTAGRVADFATNLNPVFALLRNFGVNPRNLLGTPGGAAAQQPRQETTAQTPPFALRAQQDRASLLSNELRLITAQTQGYKEQELALKLAVVADKEKVDLTALKLRLINASSEAEQKALGVEIDARRTQTLKERLQLEEELAEVRRKNRITQETRPGIQQQSLALINAQVTGSQRQALIEESRLATLETERQLRLEGNRDPVRRGEIIDRDILAQARFTAQLNQLDKERAAASRQITFDAREQAQASQRQLTFARQRLTTEAGIVRQTLEQRQAAVDAIATAAERQQRAQFSLTEALRQGGDTGQQRAFEIASKDLPEASRQLQLSLITGATALKDAGREVSRSIRDNARALQDLYLTSEFATGEQRQRAIQDLDRQVEAEARRRGVIFTVSGTEQERTAAKQGFLGFGRQEAELIRQGNQLAEALSIANKPLVDSNSGLVSSQTSLIEAINTLNQKNWAVNVSVASDGTVSPAGDILSRAATAL